MAGAFRIAEGFVEVTADESAYDRSMERLKSTRHQVKVGVDVDDKDALAQLSRLGRNLAVKVNVNLAGTSALAQLTRDTRDRTTKVIVSVDATQALARLTEVTRERSVKVRVDLDQAPLAQLANHSYTANIVAQINDPAYQRAKTLLDKLTAERTVIIRASADTRVAAAELRNLVQRQRVRIGVDVDTRVAADSLANLTRRRTMTVAAQANTTEARARLDALARDRHVNLNVDVDQSAMSRISSMFSGAGGGMGILSGRIAQIAGAALGALPTLASLGQSIIAMAPAAAIAVPAVLSLGAAFAAIKIGTSGIGDAFKAAFAPAAQSASTALSATKAVEAAQRSLAKAQQGVKDAEVNAAAARVKAARDVKDAQLALKNTVVAVADANRRAVESVTRAERDLANAQRAETQAQEDLTQARKDAKQQLEDLNNQLADAHLNERDDILAVQDAQANLDAVKAKGAGATAEELAKAQLEYDKAVQALKEQQTETARLEEQTAAANAAGVDGSAQVVTAEQGVADAKQNTADQAQALADAQLQATRTQTDGAQQIAKAQRDVADAQAAATKAATDGARSIADAQQAVATAAQAVADAQTSAALKTGTLSAALAKLSPNAQAFVQAVLDQRAAWTALKLDVQDRLFAGLGDKFRTMSTAILPSLTTGLTGTAGVLNTMAKNAADAVTQLGKTGALKKLFSGLNDGLKPLSKIPGQFITALAQIGIAASPAFKRLTTAAGDMATKISDKLTKAFKNGHLEKAIDGAIDIAKQFGRLIGDIFGTIGNVMKAASKGGGDALGSIGIAAKELRRITAMPEVQTALTNIFKMINTIAKLLVGAFGKALIQLVEGFGKIAPAITDVLSGLGDIGPLIGGILLATNPLVGAFVLLAPIIGKLVKPITGLVKSMAPLLEQLSTFAGSLIEMLAPVIGSLIDVLAGVFKAVAPIMAKVAPMLLKVVQSLAGPLSDVIQSLIPLIGPVLQIVTALPMAFLPLVPALLPLLPPIAQLILSLVKLAVNVITPLMPLITGLAGLLADVLAGAIGILVPVISTVIDWITKFVDAISAGVKWVVDQFQHLYDVLVGHSIIPDLVNAIISWFTNLWDNTKKIFTTLKNWVVDLWNGLWSTVRSKWNDFWSGLKSAISGAWTSVKNSVSSLKTSLTNTWSSMWNGLRDKVSSIFTTVRNKVNDFKTAMKNAFAALRDGLGTIWKGIQSKFSTPVKWVIGNVYNDGIRKMWNTIASKISSKITLPAVKLGFNSGGVVPGSGNRDTVPAMLTPGERVLSNPEVAKLGGYRAIDAMLGKDRPTRTGGDPSRSQERTRQASQAFADGGIVGTIADLGKQAVGALGSGLDWAKNLVVGGLKAAAQKAIESLVRPLINRIPAGGVGSLMKGMSNKALSGMLNFLGGEDKKANGGPAVQNALGWAKTQNGLPYQWGGNGNPSWDCSGLMSAIESVIRGEKPHRRWATGSFSGSNGPAGWVRNLISPFQIGVTHAGVGHTAGTIGGVNVESRGGDGVIVGKRARGYNDPLFTSHWGFQPATKYDSGGLLQPGATMAINNTGKPEAVLTADEKRQFEQLVRSGAGGGVTIQSVQINGTFDFSSPSSRKAAANAMVKEMKEALRQFDRDRR